MKVFIRADASVDIGTGHVMRCLVLADQLRQRGSDVYFICRLHDGHLIDLIGAAGYQVVPLSVRIKTVDSDDTCFLGASWEDDASETIEVLRNAAASWVVVDHFGIDARWERLIKQSLAEIKIMVIDGYCNRSHACDMLLDQTCSLQGQARWHSLVPPACRVLTGPRYALLRPEFKAAKRAIKEKPSGRLSRFFVSFGGVDKPNATQAVLGVLTEVYGSGVAIDVLLGQGNPHITEIQREYGNCGSIKLHVQPPDVAKIMREADLGITAGGTTVWELCALRIPMLIMSIADNQIELARNVELNGGAVYLGAFTGAVPNSLCTQLNRLATSKEGLIEMRIRQAALMPGDEKEVSDYMLEMQS